MVVSESHGQKEVDQHRAPNEGVPQPAGRVEDGHDQAEEGQHEVGEHDGAQRLSRFGLACQPVQQSYADEGCAEVATDPLPWYLKRDTVAGHGHCGRKEETQAEQEPNNNPQQLDGSANVLGPPPTIAVGYGDLEDVGGLTFDHYVMDASQTINFTEDIEDLWK